MLARWNVLEHVKDVYDSQGFLFPIEVLTAGEKAKFLEHFQTLELNSYELPRYVGGMHFSHLWGYELSVHPRVLDAVEQVLGPDLLVESAMILTKYPRDAAFAPWHQDGEYSQWHRSPAASAWIALTDSCPENGCMQVIPGSHLGGRKRHSSDPVQDSMFKRSTRIMDPVNEDLAINVVLRAGEMSIHHGSIIHGSKPNLTDTKRAGFIIRFVTPAFAYNGRPYPLIRARGAGDCTHLSVTAGPPGKH